MSKRVVFLAATTALVLSACGAPAFDEDAVGTLSEAAGAEATDGALALDEVRSNERADIDALRANMPEIQVVKAVEDVDGDGIPGATDYVDVDNDGEFEQARVDSDLDGDVDEVRFSTGADSDPVVLKDVSSDLLETVPAERWTVHTDVVVPGAVLTGPEGETQLDDTVNAVEIDIDTDDDGVADTTIVDTDGDGRIERVETDEDNDGFPEFLCINHNFDEACEETFQDTDGDGEYDINFFDSDGDGVLEEIDLTRFTPEYEVLGCYQRGVPKDGTSTPDGIVSDEADYCELDWNADGVADMEVNLVTIWPEDAMDIDGDGEPDPIVLFETPPEELVNPFNPPDFRED